LGRESVRCSVCGSAGKVVMHHTSYSPERLVPLCRSCHAKAHSGSLDADLSGFEVERTPTVKRILNAREEQIIKHDVESGLRLEGFTALKYRAVKIDTGLLRQHLALLERFRERILMEEVGRREEEDTRREGGGGH